MRNGSPSIRGSLTDEYRSQYVWRDWKTALSLCPIAAGQQVLDLGCGPGDVAADLAARGACVTGIDQDLELLSAARQRNPQCTFERQDLNSLHLTQASYDGIWSSFAAAYFVDFPRVFSHWASFLKPNGWVCVVDIDDLLGHEPMSQMSQELIIDFYEDARRRGRHDCNVGRKIESALKDVSFHVRSVLLQDQELSFDGPASPDIIRSWKARLSRMGGFKALLGDRFPAFVEEFVQCISSPQHRSHCRVVCCVGTRLV